MNADTEADRFLQVDAPGLAKMRNGLPTNVGGRPPIDYCEEIGVAICERVADGEFLTDICKDGALPSRATVFRWLAKVPEFAQMYAFAVYAKIDGLADELIKIADDKSQDYQLIEQPDGSQTLRLDKEVIARSMLRITTRQWVMGKQLPKRYGELPEMPDMPTEPAQDYSNARVVKGEVVIENDPLHDSFVAWSNAAKSHAAGK